MQDLLLWRTLRRRRFASTEVLSLLRELAQASFLERLPFFGLLPPALTHIDPEVRAAAVSVLRGAKGRLALQRLVAALHDPELPVRLAAVESLREALQDGDWPRWVHVLFHPDLEVRTAGVTVDRPFPPPILYKLFLLPDPVCGPTVQQHLEEAILGADALPLLFEYVKRGLLSPPLARQLASRVSWQDWLKYLDDIIPKDDDLSDSVAKALQPDWPDVVGSHYRADRLDDVVHLFWEVDLPRTPGEVPPSDRFFDRLLAGTLSEPPYFRPWTVFTLLCVAALRGSWSARAAEACAVLEFGFLSSEWVPRQVRHAALAGIYRMAERCPRRSRVEIVPVLLGDLCLLPSGELDLWAVGAVVRILDESPYELLVEELGLAPIVSAFLRDIEQGVAFLSLTDPSPGGQKARRLILREIAARAGVGQRARVLALMAGTVSSDGLDFLDALDGPGACQVFEQLLTARPSGRKLSSNKVRRLADLLAGKIVAGQISQFLRVWLHASAPEDSELGLAILGRLARSHDPRFLDQALRSLDPNLVPRFLPVATCCAGFPYDQELRLADAVAEHPDEAVRAWAEVRLRHRLAPPQPRKAVVLGLLRGAGGKEEPTAYSPALLKVGLCERLRAEPDPAEPNRELCLALLASHDPVSDVDEQFVRFSSPGPEFLDQFDQEMVADWQGEVRLPLLGHAWLYRWDLHASAFAVQLAAMWPEGLSAALRFANTLKASVLRQRFWEATARLVEIWRWHDRPRLAATWTNAGLAPVLAETLSSDVGSAAADILLKWFAEVPQSPALAQLKDEIMARMAALPRLIRDQLRPLIDSRGLPPAPDPTPEMVEQEVLARIDASFDLDFLMECTRQPGLIVPVRAVQRLLAVGDAGLERLVERIRQVPPSPELRTLMAGIRNHWPANANLHAIRRLHHDRGTPLELRFHLAYFLYQQGEKVDLSDTLTALHLPDPPDWFEDTDWSWLVAMVPMTWDLALLLARAPSYYAYQPAVEFLMNNWDEEDDAAQALLEFLELGTERMRELRLRAAEWLCGRGRGELAAFLLLQREPAEEPAHPRLFAELPGDLTDVLVSSVLMAGQGEKAEKMLLALLKDDSVDESAREEGYGRLLASAETPAVRQEARRLMRPSLSRAIKLRRVAETFAWGIRIGRELTGKLFSLVMIAGEALGYTRFRENKLFITPMPILRGQPFGRQVVRALILHEYGHHMYHRGEEAEAIWKQSEDEKIHQLLNLAADEHLERNLRALDRSFGNQLKLLAAYAFQHTNREFLVENLLTTLGGRAFAVLSAARLGVARRKGCVLVSNGRLLLEMERAGFSFARFIRALRMGMGNRHGDPKVSEALALFKGRKFRKSTMPELLEIARELRRIFGSETDLLNSFSQDDSLSVDDSELADASEDISGEELDSAVQGALQVRRRVRAGDQDSDAGGGRGINLDEDEDFKPITTVKPVPFDAAQHARYAEQVARPAQQMRRYFRDLGLGPKPQRFRMRGKSLDRTRIKAVVLRGDPRMLIARELRRYTDLFLGVVIDCSGSMASNRHLEKAKLFGTLLAEATKGHPGIDLRLFGFTDRVIYDAGTANRCAVHGLHAENGNNDAAGLWHAAQAARASRRRAKLLVMISDGSPTECSVAALAALVKRVTRQMKISCAQVAVCPLDQICFPHYVLLDEDSLEESVRRFGAVMTRLVGQALR
jgi:hypothetical protein